jgi:hypothetical protein
VPFCIKLKEKSTISNFCETFRQISLSPSPVTWTLTLHYVYYRHTVREGMEQMAFSRNSWLRLVPLTLENVGRKHVRTAAGVATGHLALFQTASVARLHRLNMEVDLLRLFGLHVTWWAQLYSLAETRNPAPLPPSPRIGTRIRGRYWSPSAKIDDISV